MDCSANAFSLPLLSFWLQAEMWSLAGQSSRKTNEEDALMEEKQFLANLTKVELRESRVLYSSMRLKLKYYGEEVARLRYIGSIPCAALGISLG